MPDASQPDRPPPAGAAPPPDEPWRLLFAGAQRARAQASTGWRKLLIWALFFALLYIMRRFFALIFLTFILCFLSQSVCRAAAVALPSAGRRLILSLWYAAVIALVAVLAIFVIPRIYEEGRQFVDKVPSLYDTAVERIEQARADNETFGRLYTLLAGEADIRDLHRSYVRRMVEGMRFLLTRILQAIWVLFLSLLFSFLILWDTAALQNELSSLQKTRLAPFYNETKETVVTFARVLGHVFQAQILIALLNTMLTLVGLALLRLPDVMFLSIIVFFASFVPVLGVIISSIPIALLAFNIAGFRLLIGVIAMILVIHFIEAYILNPRIYGARMKINPVLVLVILLVGHHFFHVWGVLLGVPVYYYLSRYAILRPADRPPMGAGPRAGIGIAAAARDSV